MTGFLPASRSITNVQVDHTALGAKMRPRIVIKWTDGAGERLELVRFGHAASEIITDLHAATLVSEAARAAYLIGFIRCHTLRRQDGG